MNTLPARLANVGAECAVLSAAFYREDWRLEILQSLSVEDFTRAETRAVFEVMRNMDLRGEKISVESLTLHDKELADAGFIKGRDLSITDITLAIPNQYDFAGYVESIKEMSARREVFRSAQTAARMIQQGEMSEVAFAELERVVMNRTATGMKRELLSPSDMADAIRSAIDERMNEAARSKKVIYSTFGRLNIASGGFEKGDLIILSAESGAGKSAFSMNLAYGIAIMEKRNLLYLNSEMSTNQNALRWAAFLSKVSHSALRNGKATTEEAKAAKETADIMKNSALWTVNMPDMQIASVLAEVRRQKAQHNIEIAVVDYIGRMDTMNMKDAKEWQVMKSAAQRLKTLAMELQLAVIMVAQLTSDGKRLAQSSYMSHEADLWLNISRISEDNGASWPWNYCVTFQKARNVEVGKQIPFYFDGDRLTFIDQRKEAEKIAGKKPTVKIGNAREEDIPK